VTATDAGGGQVDVDIPGASGGISTPDLSRLFQVSAVLAAPNSNTPQYHGYNAQNASITLKTQSTTDFASTLRGFATETSSTANATAYTYNGSGTVFRGNAAGRGGFKFQGSFGFIEDVSTAPRFFHGLAAPATWVGTADPSSQVNIIGLAIDSTDSNLHLMHNDGSGIATDIDLGANFPWTIGAAYMLTLECAPNGNSVTYVVQRLDDRTKVASGTLSTDLPANTVFLSQMQWASSGPSGGGQMIVKCYGMAAYDKMGEP
jgi:hypothetical protein